MMDSNKHFGFPYIAITALILTVTGCTTPFQIRYDEASRIAMCPGSSGATPSADKQAPDGMPWIPQTACEAAIIQAAVDRCIGASSTTNDIFNAENVSESAGIALDATASAFDGIFSSAMGVVTNPLLASTSLVATLGTSIARAFSGSSGATLSIKNMYAAAGSYSLNNQKLAKDETYYKGLWNAVGSVCPPSPVFGSFEMEKISSGYATPANPKQ